MEKLFFTGLLLTALAFTEMYVTAANDLFSQDRTLVAISALLKRLEAEKVWLQILFDTKQKVEPQTAAPTPPADMKQINERQRLILMSRRKLGLPAPKPKPVEPPPNPTSPTENYGSALQDLVNKSVHDDKAGEDVLMRYRDPSIAPARLIKQLYDDKANIEKQPFSVWGIRTPRLIGFQYAGSNFEFPYLFVASALIVLLPGLIAGWVTSIYMTRQRELNEIVKVGNVSAVFPHVLNFVPVNFRHVSGRSYSKKEMMGQIVLLAIMRMMVVTILIGPMLIAFAYALIHIWNYSSAVNLAMPFLAYIAWMALMLYVQEGAVLGPKYFDEP